MTQIQSLFLSSPHMSLATDLYQLTMMASYLHWEMEDLTTFELFVRRLPKNRAFLVAAGLEQVVHFLQNATFVGEDIDFLRALPVFEKVSPKFWERLRAWSFSGSLWAIPEGTPVFANEAILQVRAPLFEAQLIETFLLSIINYQTSIASKASRIVHAAQGRSCVDFGTRRAHGPQAALYGARAAYIAGMDGTSNVLAGKLCNIPLYGTAAHAYIMAHQTEIQAFEHYHQSFPNHTTLLIDTYDTLEGARKASRIPSVKGVRLDSGDLAQLSKEVRKILDQAGRKNTKIIASNDLNEYKIKTLLDQGAPIDAFGVGTELITSKDHPALGGVYKLVSQNLQGKERPVMKWAENKMTYPGIKQFWRVRDEDQMLLYDLMHLKDHPKPMPNSSPLLKEVMHRGKLVHTLPSLQQIRQHCAWEIQHLPETLKQIHDFGQIELKIGQDILDLIETLRPA